MRSTTATLALLLGMATTALAQPAASPEALALAEGIAARPANEGRVGTMHFKLTNSSGSSRSREALMCHSEADEAIRIAIFFTEPAMIRDTAFLSFDHDAREDENWLYLPATQRVRRLPVSDRGDYFMGTDLSYGDIKDDFKFGLEDWVFTDTGEEQVDGIEYRRLEGVAASPDAAAAMGYTRFSELVDAAKGFPVDIVYSDIDKDPVKHIKVHALEQIGGAWTAMAFTVSHLQTGHTTEISFTDMRHRPDLDDSV
ncbi:MAG: outer membrane lipoprotein-sorting protein, partial [Chromatocurvus sp.]